MADDAWIEKVVKITSALGMNPMRTRWKLIRWQEKRRQAARRREQQVEHVTYEHKTCDECGAVQDREATQCSRCDAKLGGRTLQVARRIGLIPRSVSVSMLLAIAMLAVYARVLVAQGGGIGSASAGLLFDFGGNWAPVTYDEPWRLLTAIFLHAGLWHIAFNLISIAVIGPQIEELYGRTGMLFLLVLTGVLANLGSDLTGMSGVGIGASGGISGLIGVAIGYGHRQGTPSGRELRNRMLRWMAFVILFGFAFNADNRAHTAGALAGAVFGYAVTPRTWMRLKPVRIAAGAIGIAALIAALAIIFTRTPSDGEAGRRTLVPYADACRMHYAGDDVAAQQAYDDIDPTHGHAPIAGVCDQLLMLRGICRRGESRDAEYCYLLEEAFGLIWK